MTEQNPIEFADDLPNRLLIAKVSHRDGSWLKLLTDNENFDDMYKEHEFSETSTIATHQFDLSIL